MTLDKLTIVLNFFLLLKSVVPFSPVFYCTYVNLLFLQPEVYSLQFLM